MNRADLHWALQSVLPHVGKQEGTALVGLAFRDEHVYVYATDNYTSAVAKVADPGSAARVEHQLITSEATDLMRFVRPTLKATEDLRVTMRAMEMTTLGFEGRQFTDLHVSNGETAEVFDLIEQSISLDTILDLFRGINERPVEYQQCVYQPSLFGRFAKAKRDERDRLMLYPRHANDRYGAALITVGADFIGAIAGIGYEESPDVLGSFLNQREVAA